MSCKEKARDVLRSFRFDGMEPTFIRHRQGKHTVNGMAPTSDITSYPPPSHEQHQR